MLKTLKQIEILLVTNFGISSKISEWYILYNLLRKLFNENDLLKVMRESFYFSFSKTLQTRYTKSYSLLLFMEIYRPNFCFNVVNFHLA